MKRIGWRFASAKRSASRRSAAARRTASGPHPSHRGSGRPRPRAPSAGTGEARTARRRATADRGTWRGSARSRATYVDLWEAPPPPPRSARTRARSAGPPPRRGRGCRRGPARRRRREGEHHLQAACLRRGEDLRVEAEARVLRRITAVEPGRLALAAGPERSQRTCTLTCPRRGRRSLRGRRRARPRRARRSRRRPGRSRSGPSWRSRERAGRAPPRRAQGRLWACGSASSSVATRQMASVAVRSRLAGRTTGARADRAERAAAAPPTVEPDPGNAGEGKVMSVPRNARYDAVVIGAGLIGLACAWRARRSGLSVLVVDRADEPGAAASRVAAGMLAPVTEADFGDEAQARCEPHGARTLAGVRRRARGGHRPAHGLPRQRRARRGGRPRRRRGSSAACTPSSARSDSRPSGSRPLAAGRSSRDCPLA